MEITNEKLFILEELSNTAEGLASVALAISMAMNEGGHSSDAYNSAVAYYENLISDFAKELNIVVSSIWHDSRKTGSQNKTKPTKQTKPTNGKVEIATSER